MNEQPNAEGQAPVSASAGASHEQKTPAPLHPLDRAQIIALYHLGNAANWIATKGHDLWYWSVKRCMEINDENR